MLLANFKSLWPLHSLYRRARDSKALERTRWVFTHGLSQDTLRTSSVIDSIRETRWVSTFGSWMANVIRGLYTTIKNSLAPLINPHGQELVCTQWRASHEASDILFPSDCFIFFYSQSDSAAIDTVAAHASDLSHASNLSSITCHTCFRSIIYLSSSYASDLCVFPDIDSKLRSPYL